MTQFLRQALLLACLLIAAGTATARPNVIVIMTDDQGYQDLGCYGSPLIATPNIDKMAAEGVRFTDFYSGNCVCSPSRAALLTGCYASRVGVTRVLFPKDTIGLNPAEITIADMAKAAGYATACIGKWHLGHLPQFLPTSNGFDQYFGIPYSNDMGIDLSAKLAKDIVFREGIDAADFPNHKTKKGWAPLMRNDEVIEYPADQSTLTQRYTAEALAFIEKNREKPFFLYLAQTMPHIPLYANEKFAGKSRRGLYGDVIEEIDWSVGEIVATLKRLSLDDNTMIVYTSDNGPWKLADGQGGSADPLRGFKFQTYDGGQRVPAIVRWPGKIPAGRVCKEIAASIDLLPTIAGITGAKIPDDRVIDGKDIWPLLAGDAGAVSPRKTYFYTKGQAAESVRSGKWKLHKEKGKFELYDLEADISEATDLAATHPEKVTELQKLMTDFAAEMQADARPVGDAGK